MSRFSLWHVLIPRFCIFFSIFIASSNLVVACFRFCCAYFLFHSFSDFLKFFWEVSVIDSNLFQCFYFFLLIGRILHVYIFFKLVFHNLKSFNSRVSSDFNGIQKFVAWISVLFRKRMKCSRKMCIIFFLVLIIFIELSV